MKIQKMIGALAASTALFAFAVAPSMAQQVSFATITAGTGANVVYTSGVGMSIMSSNNTASATYLLTTPNPNEVTAPVNYSFTGLTTSGSVIQSGSSISQNLTGGSFTITAGSGAVVLFGSPISAGDVLLSGTFGGAVITGDTGNSTGNVNTTFSNVAYDNTPLTSYFVRSGLFNPGSFSIALSSVSPTFGVTGSTLNGFSASGSGNFSADTVTPEPSSVAAFAFTGFGLLGLMLFARKRRSSMTA